ncbi:hypothetical protein ACFWEH_26630 [Streptomyces anulatus]|uniref:hypothetical protein n=1 Tax=Streptomyces TaxID=1883 RepID=UPI001F51671D|nr:hypothetical protein [Streptomyces sp. TSRI0395]
MCKLEVEQPVPVAQLVLALLGLLQNVSLLQAEERGHALRWPLMGCLTDDLPLLELLCAADEVRIPGELESSFPHENAPDAVTDTYVVDGGRLLLTLWHGRLHEVIYRTPAESVEDASRRNDRLFAHYGQGDGWTEILDNGFGRTYRRTDQQRYAFWSYAMDITTFGTMGFHQVKW